jgi:hypothetical protein
LERKLARRHQDQTAWTTGSRLANAHDHRKAKRERLARTGWCAATNIVASKRVGDGCRLNGRRELDTRAGKGTDNVLGQAELSKSNSHLLGNPL